MAEPIARLPLGAEPPAIRSPIGAAAEPPLAVPGVGEPSRDYDMPNVRLVEADIPRDSRPESSGSDLRALISADSGFAFDLYHALGREQANLFLSPFSIASDMAMTYAGAHGQTAKEMAAVLHLPFEGDRLHAARNSLDLAILRPLDPGAQHRLQRRAANSLWVQTGVDLRRAFLITLARNYGAGVRTVDFAHAPETARRAINEWIEDTTQGRVRDLIGQGMIDERTRLLLANAVHFKALWAQTFHYTNDEPFYDIDGSTQTVAMMHTLESFAYAAGKGYRAISLPYRAGASMLVIVPERGGFDEVERQLNQSFLAQVRRELNVGTVDLGFPRFHMTSRFSLRQVLGSLGMSSAFAPPRGSSGADFTGMTHQGELFIHHHIHHGWIAVDEKGTEAGAATVGFVSVGGPGEPAVRLVVDRPFFFAIEDDRTQVLLFVGRLVKPMA